MLYPDEYSEHFYRYIQKLWTFHILCKRNLVQTLEYKALLASMEKDWLKLTAWEIKTAKIISDNLYNIL